ncbi:MAG: N-6 DNA methylase [Candidatus Eisenbacteria bacterium]|nr:N-6 DNA methylase [Candidatus Eisenbacteria bacterium]
MSVEVEGIAAEQARGVADELLRIAGRGGTEADFRREAASLLEEAGARAGLTIVPRDEFSVARGRVDSVYNRLVLEYKRPGVIRESNRSRSNRDVIQQVKNYILDVAARERREAQRLAGVATDGFYFIFIRRVGEGWSVDNPAPVTPASTERFLRLLFSLSSGAALVPENLVEDFGPRTLRAQRAVRALYTALHASKHPLVVKLFEQWRQFFSEATDYKEWAGRIESKKEFRSFVKGMGLDPKYAEAPKVFFALHTYYALLIKLVASLAAARFAGDSVAPLRELANKQGEELREAFADVERGGLFREYGIRNFLEGDFFGWYLAAWDHDIEDATSGLVQRLADYDPGTLELAPENARDLLKKLYHYLLPREIRHDLGEYYTPDWLAERLIIQTLGKSALGDPTKRVLDPACGSGTFLVILIKYIKERLSERKLEPTEVLDAVLRNVIGFDLNPLAVIAARTNYLLALGDLLKARRGDIDIPVYQCDSVLTPSQGSDLFTDGVYQLKTSVSQFRIPSAFAERERMDTLANMLDESMESGIGSDAFLHRLRGEARLPAKEMAKAEGDLADLYRQLKELHDQGLNGVWSRVIKNAFAPLFIETSDYVIGNPPWVNWESLPDDYRKQTKPLWQHYGLFPHSGMDTILGKGKKDLSMLMTYVCVDRYLKTGGKLGFVLSQTLFKTSGAGQGFRRFLLPQGEPFRPLVVEDMVELKPFEGATNRTAVAVFLKGQRVRYPVSYQYWKKRGSGRGSAIGFDTPYEEVTTERITFRAWHAEPVDKRDPTSSWITARRRALRALRNVLGTSPYAAHEGSNSGGANAVYWVEIVGQRPGGLCIVTNVTEGGKKKVARTQAAVETDLLYPLLRGRDVARWHAVPSIHILMAQDPETRRGIAVDTMEKEFPKAHSYLTKFEKVLKARPALRRYFRDTDPFWSMFNVSSFTLAPWKVVWREQASTFMSAVVGSHQRRPVVPDHKLMMVAVASRQEAHYLCAALNSAPSCLAVAAYAITIQMNTHILENVGVPQFSTSNTTHLRLAELSEDAHKAIARGKIAEVKKIEEEIDRAAARLWGLKDEELAEIKQSLEEA